MLAVHKERYRVGRAGRPTVGLRRTWEQQAIDERYLRELAELEIKDLRRQIKNQQREASKLRRQLRESKSALHVRRLSKALQMAGIDPKAVAKDGANVSLIVESALAVRDHGTTPRYGGEGGKGGGVPGRSITDLRPD